MNDLTLTLFATAAPSPAVSWPAAPSGPQRVGVSGAVESPGIPLPVPPFAGRPKMVRVSDPDTSHQAANSVRATTGMRERQILDLFAAHPEGLCDWQLVELILAEERRTGAKRLPKVGTIRTARSRCKTLGVHATGLVRRSPDGSNEIVWMLRRQAQGAA